MTTQKNIGPNHYRYREENGEDGVTLICDCFAVIKETPRGYWVIREIYAGGYWGPGTLKKYRKFVLKDSVRRHCYPERKDALDSYRIRKLRQIGHLKLSLASVEQAHQKVVELLAANTIPDLDVACGKPEYFNQFNWGDL
jgi:hypothetical protein